ncbi:hypothetical protein HYZ99_03970 [Candidatus Peregrinibacteria bacterium]|nr:hypothetical protein [Candidatus Peregrinibacteria bacterium]
MPKVPQTAEDKLDLIVKHLERMDKRDRIRTWGGFVRTILGFIPLLIFIASVWYFYNNADAILKKITEQAAEQALKMSPFQ